MKRWKGKNGPLLIAEIGGNHEGDFEYAKKLCELAILSSADYVKFQIYTGDTLVSPIEGGDRNKHFKKFELTKEQHIELAEMVIRSGAKYTASVWDIDVMEWIDPYMDFYKIGSGDLTAYSIIEAIVKRKKPIIISTGLADENEVIETVKFIRSLDDMYWEPDNLAVLQCTSMYPIEYSDANLSVIPRLKKLLNTSVGYSDHTIDNRAMLYAYAIGAEILEFHFTDSREDKLFRDHKVSLTKDEVLNLINEIKIIDQLLGSEIKQPTKIESETNHIISFRRGVYPIRDIEPGETITSDLLTTLRPNIGTDAREIYSIIGKKAMKKLSAYCAINKNDFQ